MWGIKRFCNINNSSNEIHLGAGTSTDWARAVANVKFTFTYELRDTGKDKFLLPPNQIIPSGKETWAGVVAMVQGVMDFYKNNWQSNNVNLIAEII